MTRGEKIIEFFTQNRNWALRWCSADACGCRGCINGSKRSEWVQQYPGEAPITHDEFIVLSAGIEAPQIQAIKFDFKSIKKKE